MKILLAVDGSKASLDAVDCLIEHADWYSAAPEVELVTVHLPVPHVKLDAAGIKHQDRVLVGQVAETLVKHAKDKRCDMIYVGTRSMSSAAAALIGSTATKVLHLSTVPVLLVK
jgi:nucleotide-binding universal stress UspA family protein